jgi:aquaporin related protein
MSTLQRKASHGMNKPMFGYFTPKSAGDSSAPRKHFVAAAGEFVGTFLFLFTAYLGHATSVQFAPNSAPGGGNSNQTVIFIALSYGFSLLIAAWVLYRVSGGLFNPVITLGMVIAGNLPPFRGLVLLPVQIIGAICAAAMVSCIIPVDTTILQTTLAPNMNVARGLFLEMVCNIADHVIPLTLPLIRRSIVFNCPFDVHSSYARS